MLIDPPFEEDEDFRRLGQGLIAVHHKWPTGVYMLWYPIKDRSGPNRFAKRLGDAGLAKLLWVEFTVAPLNDPARLNGCGLIVANPPWTLAGDLAILLPELTKILARGRRSGFRLGWLAGERAATR